MTLLDKVRRENGTKSLRVIAGVMNLRAPSRVSALLRGQSLPADEDQVRALIHALGGGTEDMEHGLRLYQAARSSSLNSARPARRGPARRGDAPAAGGYPVSSAVEGLEARDRRAVVHLPYIHRDVEDEVRTYLDSGRPVLLVGSSMVGKTRMATTLIKEMPGTRQLFIPETKDALVALVAPGVTLRDSIIFLDNIERLIGVGGITQTALRHLAERNVIIGAIRALLYDGYLPTDQLRPLEWDVLNIFEPVIVLPNLSPAEQQRVREAVDDTDAQERILRTGVGEYVGGAERISETLRLGPSLSPVGLALVQGAADWARTGMSAPTPASLLPVLAGPHLDARTRLSLDDNQKFQDALHWATRAINPTVSLLQQEQRDAFSVFDYALDQISGQNEPIPEATWPVLIQHASPADLMNIGRTASTAGRPEVAEQAWHRVEETGEPETAPMAALFLGAQLREQGDMEGAQAAYQRAITSGHADAAPAATFNLGNLLKKQGDLEGAQAAYQRAVDSGHPRVIATAAVSLGKLLAQQGDISGARDAYQRAINSDLDIAKLEASIRTQLAARADAQTRPVHLTVIDARRWHADPEAVATATLSLGDLSAKQGDAEGARQAYLRAANSGQPTVAPKAMLALGNLQRDQGDVDGARTAFSQVIDSGDPDIGPKAASNLGIMLHQEGDVAGAQIAFQYAANAGHPEASPLAAFNLGVLLAEEGDADGARDAYQRAGELGNVEIMKAAMRRTLQLGILLAEQGDLNGARTAYQSAVGFGQADMAPWPMIKLAIALHEHGDAETACAALQSAIDSAHPPVVAVASLGLGNMLADRGDIETARAAFQRAVDSGYAQIAAAASLGLGWLLADHGDIAAARDAFQRAVHSEYAQIAVEAAQNLRALP